MMTNRDGHTLTANRLVERCSAFNQARTVASSRCKRPHRHATREVAAQSITELIEAAPVLTSEDEVVDDFPEPLNTLAFQGLAGDIVRRIEPHTEADRAHC